MSSYPNNLDQSDLDIALAYADLDETVLELATSSASLDRSPKKNWVENAGGLPPYVRKLARAISRRGKSLDRAIAIAISRVKAWAAGGGDVDADTRAKAVKALAQWNAIKAKSAAKSKVKMSAVDGAEYIALSSASSYNVEIVRSAWNARESARRKAQQKESYGTQTEAPEPYAPYRYISELGSDYIIVTEEDGPSAGHRYKSSYVVDSNDNVFFGPERRIVQLWVEDSGELSADELRDLARVLSSADAIKNIKSLLRK